MNWDQARMFLAVGRQGQFLAASKSLGVNQATLSRHISALESAIGTKLLTRRTNGCELTEAGEKLLASLERAETEIQSGLDHIADKDAEAAGTVRIGAPDGFGVGFLSGRLAQFSEHHPSIKLELVPVPRSFSLSRREADIAIMIGRPEKGKLVARKLTDYSLGLYASPEYLLRNGEPQNRSDLLSHRLIGFVDDLIYTRSLDYTHEFSSRWRSSLAISSAAGQLEAAKGGAGIAILHDYLAKDDPALKTVLVDQKIKRTYWLAMHETQRNLARIRAVTEFIAEIVASERMLFSPDIETKGIGSRLSLRS